MELTFTKERISVVDPGFAISKTETFYFFSKKAIVSTSWYAMLTVFDSGSWLLIALSFTILSMILTASFGIQNFNFQSFAWSFALLTKAYFGASLDTDFIFKMTKGKHSKYFMIWSISFLGGFNFWYFTGVLISLLNCAHQTFNH